MQWSTSVDGDARDGALEAGGVSHHCWSTKGEGLERKSQTATRTTVTLLNRSKDPKQGKLAIISGPEVEERGGGALLNGERSRY